METENSNLTMDTNRVLIVEDEAVVAADINDRVTALGYVVAGTVSSGEDAILKTSQLKPDLILMDIVLEGELDGVQTAEQLAQSHDIPIVFLTAHADELTVRRAKHTGPFGYVLKPFEERELSMVMSIALYRSRTESRLAAANKELHSALAQIKTLRGLLPICAWCKKIHQGDGYWEKLETYIMANTEAVFTHGVCPDCKRKVLEEAGLSRST
jgi:CheY-like chemotaxis protein